MVAVRGVLHEGRHSATQARTRRMNAALPGPVGAETVPAVLPDGPGNCA